MNVLKNILARKHCYKLWTSDLKFFGTTTNRSFEEVRISLPWGHLAAKWWGPHDQRPIVALHGWQDNSGSFDTLVPYLPPNIGILAVDCPGHGLSSQIPPGAFYHGMDGPILLRRLQKYFRWNKISLMGHSMGAIISFTYTLLYPEMVDLLICIDGLKPIVHNSKKIDRIVTSIEDFLKYDELNRSGDEPPSYTMEELTERLHNGLLGSINLNKCHHILERNVRPSKKDPTKYYFSRDPRLKAGQLVNWEQKVLVDNASRITCPVFLSKADGSPFFENKKHLFDIVDELKKSAKAFEFHEVEGSHHVHLNNPEIIGPLVTAFIVKNDVEARDSGGITDAIRKAA